MPVFGIMSDIHSNLSALEAALAILRHRPVDRIYCIGDIVGYGAEPEECCIRVRESADAVVAGNHDFAVCDRIDYLPIFGPAAILGVLYAKKFLRAETMAWIGTLPLTHEDPWLHLVHGSLERPELFWYLHNNGEPGRDEIYQDVSLTFNRMTRPICFVGHSHRPMIYIEAAKRRIETVTPTEAEFDLGGRRAVVNVGSVGTPRTGDQLGSVVIYNSDRNTLLFRFFPVAPSLIPEWIASVLDWPAG